MLLLQRMSLLSCHYRYPDRQPQEFVSDLDLIVKQQAKDKAPQQLRRKICRKDHHCSICHETVPRKTPTYSIKCRHIFHAKCLDSWRTVKNNCPLCREQLK